MPARGNATLAHTTHKKESHSPRGLPSPSIDEQAPPSRTELPSPPDRRHKASGSRRSASREISLRTRLRHPQYLRPTHSASRFVLLPDHRDVVETRPSAGAPRHSPRGWRVVPVVSRSTASPLKFDSHGGTHQATRRQSYSRALASLVVRCPAATHRACRCLLQVQTKRHLAFSLPLAAPFPGGTLPPASPPFLRGTMPEPPSRARETQSSDPRCPPSPPLPDAEHPAPCSLSRLRLPVVRENLTTMSRCQARYPNSTRGARRWSLATPIRPPDSLRRSLRAEANSPCSVDRGLMIARGPHPGRPIRQSAISERRFRLSPQPNRTASTHRSKARRVPGLSHADCTARGSSLAALPRGSSLVVHEIGSQASFPRAIEITS